MSHDSHKIHLELVNFGSIWVAFLETLKFVQKWWFLRWMCVTGYTNESEFIYWLYKIHSLVRLVSMAAKSAVITIPSSQCIWNTIYSFEFDPGYFHVCFCSIFNSQILFPCYVKACFHGHINFTAVLISRIYPSAKMVKI